MEDIYNISDLKGWEAFNKLPQKNKSRLNLSLVEKTLQPGEIFCRQNGQLPGIMYIKQGIVRVIGIDQGNEPYTI